jgi:hypothetical protein
MQAMMRVAGAFSKQAREPMVATAMVSGHRMVHINPHTTQIIDLDKETITDINLDKKTYSVMTFAEMKQMLEDMAKKMQKGQAENDVQYKASVKETGQTKTINGLIARELLLTLTMEGTDKQTGNTGSMDVSSDMWMAPVAGYEEVRNFYRLYAAKMGMMPGQNMGMLMARPQMVKAMGDLYKEMAKLDGAPVQMITRMGATGTVTAPPPNSSGAQQQAPPPSQTAGQTAAGAALGRLGLGGLGRRKKNEDQQQQQQSSSTQPPPSGEPQTASGVLMEMTTDSSGFSTAAVDPSKFAVPAGFKQVEPEMGRRGR